MKKTFALIILLFLLLFSVPCSASMTVSPLEVSITMDEVFIHGNTSKKMTVKNNEGADVNVSWYIEHPNPISWMRPNRTYIPDLSWVDVEPKWYIIPPGGSAEFYIHLDVPEDEENRGQHWETWVTFKQEPTGGLFNFEQAVRVLIDTPPSDASSQSDQFKLPLPLLVIVIAVALFIVGVLIYKKR